MRKHNTMHFDRVARTTRWRADQDGDLVLRARMRAAWPERTATQLADLVARAGQGARAARQELVLQYAFLVERYARYTWRGAHQALRQSVSLDDLRQEGRLGLLRAAELYDPARGASFITYAVTWIRSRISRLVMDHGTTVRVPVGVARPWRNRDEWASQLGREVVEAVDRAHTYVDVDDVSLAAEADDQAAREERGRLVRGTVADMVAEGKLSPREVEVITRRYFGDEEDTLQDVGASFGVSRERARQIEAEATAKVRREVLRRYPDLAEG